MKFKYGNNSDLEFIEIFTSNEISKSKSNSKLPLIIFIHGGAWVDECVEDHYDFKKLIEKNNCVIALIEYRKSNRDFKVNKIVHPTHTIDVFKGIELLLSNDLQEKFNYNFKGCTIIGHSAGVFMALALALNSGIFKEENNNLYCLIDKFIFIEGIFSIYQLFKMYPSYKSFLQPAFFKSNEEFNIEKLQLIGLESWNLFESNSYYNKRNFPKTYIFHSKDDELLNKEYNENGIKILQEKGIKPIIDNTTLKGFHDQVIHSEKLFEIISKLCF